MPNRPARPAVRWFALRGAPWLLLAGLCGSAMAAVVDRYEGDAYARGSERLVYRETHWRRHLPGAGVERLVLYRCPDGAAFARKRVAAGPRPEAPDFEFFDARDGYREGVRSVDGGREVFVQPAHDASERREPLQTPPSAVIDAGFDAFVRSRWDALAAGDAQPVPFLLPSRAGFIDVRVVAATPSAGAAEASLRRIRLQLDHWLGFALPSIDLVYRDADRWLLEFAGTASIRDARGRHQSVRIVFPPERRATLDDPAAFDQAARQPLVATCAG